jgi:tetratricopeptide (TPR) repeat protein
LHDNLDQARALTDVLLGGDATMTGRAVSAALDLPALSRCADVEMLRSAVPLPRDQHTLEAVQAVRASLREAQSLRDVGNFQGAQARVIALRPRAEATGYGPLLAEVLELEGGTGGLRDWSVIGRTLHESLYVALASHDDATASRAATDLIWLTGSLQLRVSDAEMWFRMSDAILDRMGPGQERTRAWARNNFANATFLSGDFTRAEQLAREAVALKERALGKDHPDVANSLMILASVLVEEGRPAESLSVADRALTLMTENGDPDSDHLAVLHHERGNALIELGRSIEAEAVFAAELRVVQSDHEIPQRLIAMPLEGVGEARLAQGRPGAAVPVLEDVLRIREAGEPLKVCVAETRFNLARALWDSHGNRTRARKLAESARQLLEDLSFAQRKLKVEDWLATHRLAKS